MAFEEIKYQLKFLIAYDIEGVLQIIKISLKSDSVFVNDFILNLGRYNDLNQETRLNLVDRESKTIELARIRYSIIGLIDSLTHHDLDFDRMLKELSTNKDYIKIITLTKWNNYDPNRSLVTTPYDNIDFHVNILPWFYDGQKIAEENLNPIISAINLSELVLKLDATNFEPFENGMVLNANHFNRFIKPIERLRTKIGMQTNWDVFPVKSGARLNADMMNELVDNLNEVLKIIIITIQKE